MLPAVVLIPVIEAVATAVTAITVQKLLDDSTRREPPASTHAIAGSHLPKRPDDSGGRANLNDNPFRSACGQVCIFLYDLSLDTCLVLLFSLSHTQNHIHSFFSLFSHIVG